MFSWVSLLLLLIISVSLQARGLGSYYQKIAATEGGTLREGVVGTFSTANPLYAVTVVDSSVSKLIFSGLFSHDASNQLVPDLADRWEADEKGQVYKVTLRKNVLWHDGKPFTATDVVFTYKTIQNPDAKSPLLSSWLGVTITALDDFTVQFSLPSPLASFPNSLITGIVPSHILANIPVSQLRSAPFNSVNPVGTGPFAWGSVEVTGTTRDNRSELVALKRNTTYHLGATKMDQYIMRTYRQEDELIKAYQKHELTAVVGLDKLPDDVKNDESSMSYNVPTDGNVMVFFNNSSDLLQNVKLRQALAYATNKQAILSQLGFSALSTNSPLLHGQLGYDPAIVQKSFNIAAANKILDGEGWVKTDNGIRKKGDKMLALHFVSQNVAEYALISQELQKQWREVGIDIDVKLRPEEDMQVDILQRHNYDILLYGISIGSDPDVFAYWHSSQANVSSVSRLNLSEYKSKVADRALEAGRTRIEPTLRAVKYKSFLVAWRDDTPAIALYQPRILYIARTELGGFTARRVTSAVDRLNTVQNWTVLQERILK